MECTQAGDYKKYIIGEQGASRGFLRGITKKDGKRAEKTKENDGAGIEKFQIWEYNEGKTEKINPEVCEFCVWGADFGRGEKRMVFLGDYFALGLVIVLCLFYFDGRSRYLSAASKCFMACLVLTAVSAVTDLLTGQFLNIHVPLWANVAINTLYFIVSVVTTSAFALYLFTKILEHAHDDHCMTYARRGLAILFAIYMAAVVVNLWTGWLFYFDAAGNYCRGPLNALGYFITICQMGLVCVCYVRNRRNASRPMRRALLQTFPVIVLCIIIQRMYPEIMLNGFVMAMVALVLFLSFQGQRQGIHTLTELNDRHRFFKEAERRMKRGEPFQTFLINIKNFGEINQKYGHLFGDELLYQFAFSLEKLIKTSLAFHMNGTVFALILPWNGQAEAEERGGVLLDFLEQGITCLNRPVDLDFVLVEYIEEEQRDSAAEFYEKLEYAAAQAYERKLRYIRYSPDMGAEMARVRYLRERIRTVDREHGFEVWFQPVQCLSTGAFCSMEALIRLREPDGTLVSPAEFIPLAEQTGHIAPITWFVVEEACALLKRAPELAGVSVSVNLPMPQLLDKGFTTRLNSIVDRAGIEHRRICLEFTERAILENFQRTQGVMEDLTREGYRFFLDDFGTGYSNFNCLLQLPFQIIKLDACLVQPVRNGTDDYAMVRTLTNLFHAMDLSVIAEGAETAEEVAALKDQGVDRIQGFALAHPMPEQALLDFYRDHPAG